MGRSSPPFPYAINFVGWGIEAARGSSGGIHAPLLQPYSHGNSSLNGRLFWHQSSRIAFSARHFSSILPSSGLPFSSMPLIAPNWYLFFPSIFSHQGEGRSTEPLAAYPVFDVPSLLVYTLRKPTAMRITSTII